MTRIENASSNPPKLAFQMQFLKGDPDFVLNKALSGKAWLTYCFLRMKAGISGSWAYPDDLKKTLTQDEIHKSLAELRKFGQQLAATHFVVDDNGRVKLPTSPEEWVKVWWWLVAEKIEGKEFLATIPMKRIAIQILAHAREDLTRNRPAKINVKRLLTECRIPGKGSPERNSLIKQTVAWLQELGIITDMTYAPGSAAKVVFCFDRADEWLAAEQFDNTVKETMADRIRFLAAISAPLPTNPPCHPTLPPHPLGSSIATPPCHPTSTDSPPHPATPPAGEETLRNQKKETERNRPQTPEAGVGAETAGTGALASTQTANSPTLSRPTPTGLDENLDSDFIKALPNAWKDRVRQAEGIVNNGSTISLEDSVKDPAKTASKLVPLLEGVEKAAKTSIKTSDLAEALQAPVWQGMSSFCWATILTQKSARIFLDRLLSSIRKRLSQDEALQKQILSDDALKLMLSSGDKIPAIGIAADRIAKDSAWATILVDRLDQESNPEIRATILRKVTAAIFGVSPPPGLVASVDKAAKDKDVRVRRAAHSLLTALGVE